MPRDLPALFSRPGDAHSCSEVSGIAQRGTGWRDSRQSSYPYRASFIRGPAFVSPSNTRGGSPVRESRPPGSTTKYSGTVSRLPFPARFFAEFFAKLRAIGTPNRPMYASYSIANIGAPGFM